MDYDYTGSLNDGSVIIYPVSSIAAEGTQDAVNQAISDLKSGNIKVFQNLLLMAKHLLHIRLMLILMINSKKILKLFQMVVISMNQNIEVLLTLI